MDNLAKIVPFNGVKRANVVPKIKKADVIDMMSGKIINPDEKKVKYRKDGGVKQSGGNKKEGVESTVYPIKDPAQLKAFINYFKDQIELADTEYRKFVAARNYLLIIVGLNSAYRISDLVRLKWGDMFYADGRFKSSINKKEKKTDKSRIVFIEKEIRDAIDLYLNVTNLEIDLDKCIFTTCKRGMMSENNAYDFIKKAVKELGFDIQIATHTLRKTFTYWRLITHKDDAMELYNMMGMLNHSSPEITLRYAGITDDMRQAAYEEIGETYRAILNDAYTKTHTNLVKISKTRLMEVIRMAYETGRQDSNADLETHLDNMETFKELIQDYIV